LILWGVEFFEFSTGILVPILMNSWQRFSPILWTVFKSSDYFFCCAEAL
jgi:hypothetical protein